ncbi:hypothetical protein Clacol_003051 [Clathrus columnatus]|uniref:non-specific serine/threonine protein kinase n=1 Tax=Clathrus columnatus TaxID=1419009 RepID=A0AAV5A5R4_9AGAM|nr:hypothetical protein Clacol_003051 [Clathrus columnatus]
MSTTEKETRYVPGGYHPVIIGDILGYSSQRQYRIMHKLGWGYYSTVWLAQTMDEINALVAVKITTADSDNSTQISREVEMLQKAGRAHPDNICSYFPTLLDHFKLHGPNGTHTVLVTEVVIPILSLPEQPPAWRKAAAYGVAQAMAQLHANQIIHGDWHRGNIGIAMPRLASQDPGDVMFDLAPPDITIALTVDAAKQTASLPAYFISPCEMGAYYKKIAGSDSPQIKILDFGSAHDVGAHPHTLRCALEAYAPEMVSAQLFENKDNPALDPPAEVWALGVTVGMRGLPFHMSKLAGHIPPHWEKWSASLSDRNITQADMEEWWASHWKTLREGCENDEDTAALVRLLKVVLVLDPKERPTAAQIGFALHFPDFSLEMLSHSIQEDDGKFTLPVLRSQKITIAVIHGKAAGINDLPGLDLRPQPVPLEASGEWWRMA